MKKIVAKKYGRNLVVVINGQKKTRVINIAEDKIAEKSIITKIERYNKKNNVTLLSEIEYLVDIVKTKKDYEAAAKKGLKKSIKKEASKKNPVKKSNTELIEAIEKESLTSEDRTKLQELLYKAEDNKKQTDVPVVNTSIPRRGEF